MKNKMRSGYTTGACATAASKGAVLMLLSHSLVSEISITLPMGDKATFQLNGQLFSKTEARCFVIKDAGDDPDITNGVEVFATAKLNIFPPLHSAQSNNIIISGGVGIGKVTKPGLAIPPGEPAINPVPLRMIKQAVGEILSEYKIQNSEIIIEISIPDGEERAKKTLNARLGIIGGLSVLGTTGIVRPISVKAWTDTIDASLDVAKACGCKSVVLSTGRSSEMAAQQHFGSLPCEAYIMMGDHVAYALQACEKRGFMQPIIACQFAKMLKIACGYENTHEAASRLELDILLGWAKSAELPTSLIDLISNANTAREIVVESNFDSQLVSMVAEKVREAGRKHASQVKVMPLLCGYNNDGRVITNL